ncbi:MAG: hypothetical protein FJ296_11120 [Planctomycetes bacterium]|nr:hypothetical protein [Planctomycetota bacterium]
MGRAAPRRRPGRAGRRGPARRARLPAHRARRPLPRPRRPAPAGRRPARPGARAPPARPGVGGRGRWARLGTRRPR